MTDWVAATFMALAALPALGLVALLVALLQGQ